MTVPSSAHSWQSLRRSVSVTGVEEVEVLDVEARLPLEDRAPSKEYLLLENKKLSRDVQVEADKLKLPKIHILVCLTQRDCIADLQYNLATISKAIYPRMTFRHPQQCTLQYNLTQKKMKDLRQRHQKFMKEVEADKERLKNELVAMNLYMKNTKQEDEQRNKLVSCSRSTFCAYRLRQHIQRAARIHEESESTGLQMSGPQDQHTGNVDTLTSSSPIARESSIDKSRSSIDRSGGSPTSFRSSDSGLDSPSGRRRRGTANEAKLHWEPQQTQHLTEKLKETWTKEINDARKQAEQSWFSLLTQRNLLIAAIVSIYDIQAYLFISYLFFGCGYTEEDL